MSEITVSLLGYGLKVVIFAVIAYVGIIGGKKFRDKKDAQKAAEGQSR